MAVNENLYNWMNKTQRPLQRPTKNQLLQKIFSEVKPYSVSI
jgi:hypothetical protein